jgi:hypothetical protein
MPTTSMKMSASCLKMIQRPTRDRGESRILERIACERLLEKSLAALSVLVERCAVFLVLALRTLMMRHSVESVTPQSIVLDEPVNKSLSLD